MPKAQPRIPGVRRLSKATSLHPTIEGAVAHTARLFKVSKSWVRATALAHYFGIDMETYHGGSVTGNLSTADSRRRLPVSVRRVSK